MVHALYKCDTLHKCNVLETLSVSDTLETLSVSDTLETLSVSEREDRRNGGTRYGGERACGGGSIGGR